MRYIGAHVSISGGVDQAPMRGSGIGASALGIFSKNQRQWKSPPLQEESIAAFKQNLKEAKISPDKIIVHDSYLINIANPEPEKRKKSIDALVDEAIRTDLLGLTYLNFHPGSGLKQLTEQETLDLIAEGVNEVIGRSQNVILLLESTAGQGSHVGYTFEQLAKVIENIDNQARVGVCLDTCHMFAAGYDIRTEETYNKTMHEFGSIVGFPFLKGLHVNDAKSEFESRVDRHDSIGKGNIGKAAFSFLMKDERLRNLPMVLETPLVDLWADEIRMLRQLAGE